MRIVTYNVNGIRAALTKGLASWAAQTDIDILCLQETKAHADQVDTDELIAAGYTYQQWHSATSKKGYSGVLTLSKLPPELTETGFGMEDYDREGRVLRTDFGDLTILNCYFPNGGQGDERQAFKYRFLDDFLAYVQRLQKDRPNLLVVGDYNIAHQEIDLHSPQTNQNSSGFLPDERKWMTKWFAETGLIDVYRHRHPTGQAYSWWSFRANARNNDKGWRIDYHSLSPGWIDKVTRVEHLKDAVHSDHCPILLDLAL
ncbi:exodeoxyribonuclease III [Neolewinella lacunae]|uniref:Exodeoxyribonuclease III n=1 Tax=Neolewinella lacunae TaxID=1517758 RepID=A0A923PIN6_9BACT|nr:exodeoxyribonuclease III [Neolewinella lacunae]MBC6994004.1 exodeoxyribonuclease III [Neolewinella lacunae]MDN3634674.1 exodeoxyribonuclease III [Neolewinella lacunae]